MARRTNDFQTIRSEGGLLPADLLRRILDPKEKLVGTRPEDYGLPQGERLNDVITQSWNRLRKHWAEFRVAAANVPEGEPATGLTNDKWNLPLLRELGFGLLPTSAGPEVAGRTYAINRFFGPVPIHLVGCGLSLDRRVAGVRGAAAANPHGLVQEFLNRSGAHLWAIVGNGLRLRLLRDNQALSRQSFLEFDLESMFAGEVYSDFVLLWLMAHATRFLPQEADKPESCWLEQWTKIADEQGTRALGDLRGGVERALQALGEGFTSHPKNAALRDALRTDQVTLIDFHGQLLRVVYRLIFLFVAEDRPLEGHPLLHPRDNSESARTARERYAAHYGAGRLRDLASKIKGSRHGDLWKQFQLLVGALSGDSSFAAARENLALPALGSFLWNPASTAVLTSAELTNHDFLEALRHLAFTRHGKVLRMVDYKNLGAEELGGVYESLLALTPQISADGARFTFAEFAGSERKTSGSYYTPDSLVQCLLDSALDPVVEGAIKGRSGIEAERAILALKVCDPAVGSGHFLVGAAHRLARHLARVRALGQGESEPSPLLYQHALRDVIGRCLYGVDINPMAAELCRVSLWLEALEPGKPLSFLDHHIRVGNSLLGATPELIAGGLPDEAFTPIEGDDKKACVFLKKRNKGERSGLGPLFAAQDAENQTRLQQATSALEELPDDRPEDILAKELAFRRHEQTEEFRQKKQFADTWCAAFVIRKHLLNHDVESSARGITQGHLSVLARTRMLPSDLEAEIEHLSNQYKFFHWHLAFPEVFVRGGFDCVLGNPPWERIQVEEKQFFSQSAPKIAAARSKDRQKLIDALKNEQPSLFADWLNACRQGQGQSHLVKSSGMFPYSGKGNVNTFALFAELAANRVQRSGYAGLILPSGVITEASNEDLFRWWIESRRIVCGLDFENSSGIFPDVHRSFRFCLVTLCGEGEGPNKPSFSFFLGNTEEIRDDEKQLMLGAGDLRLLNPASLTCPPIRSRKDTELLLKAHRNFGIFIADQVKEGNPWSAESKQMLNSSHDSESFVEIHSEIIMSMDLRGVIVINSQDLLRLYDGKMVDQFDHRLASAGHNPSTLFRTTSSERTDSAEHARPDFLVTPQYWVALSKVKHLVPDYCAKRRWWLAFRAVTASTNWRTVVATVVPLSGQVHSLPALYCPMTAADNAALVACLNSFALDYCARLKLSGTHLSHFVFKQLPVAPPNTISNPCSWSKEVLLREWLLPRVLELIYTAWDLEPFAQDCGWSGPPFRWDEERRFLLRCELDAAFFQLYLPAEKFGNWRSSESEPAEDLARLKASFPTPRDAIAYIMDTFPIVRRRDEEKFGDYRTKLMILRIYDNMQKSIATGETYQTILEPPPAHPSLCHPPREA